jgi:hypothetical protein
MRHILKQSFFLGVFLFVEEFTAAGNAAKAKCGLLSRNPVGYFFVVKTTERGLS